MPIVSVSRCSAYVPAWDPNPRHSLRFAHRVRFFSWSCSHGVFGNLRDSRGGTPLAPVGALCRASPPGLCPASFGDETDGETITSVPVFFARPTNRPGMRPPGKTSDLLCCRWTPRVLMYVCQMLVLVSSVGFFFITRQVSRVVFSRSRWQVYISTPVPCPLGGLCPHLLA